MLDFREGGLENVTEEGQEEWALRLELEHWRFRKEEQKVGILTNFCKFRTLRESQERKEDQGCEEGI